METICVKYIDDEMIPLEFVGGKSDWIDLRSAEDAGMNKGEFRLINLGVAMKLPDGYEAHVIPRSSTFKNFRIIQTNSMGLIDSSYCGDEDYWFFPAYAVEDTVINKNDRIAQFRIVKKQGDVHIQKVSKLSGQNRGGHGSTGVK